MCAGGTRFIGLYLARQLVEAGHEVTLFTRGKKKVAYEIPDDTPASFASFSRSIKHIQGDRMVCRLAVKTHRRKSSNVLQEVSAALIQREKRCASMPF